MVSGMLKIPAPCVFVRRPLQVWPWSYDECDRALQPKQRVTSCSPSPHFEFEPYEGRGAPEIDILEAMAGWDLQKPTSTYKPYFSSSLQIAPGITGKDRPQKVEPPRTTTPRSASRLVGLNLNASLSCAPVRTVRLHLTASCGRLLLLLLL